MSDGRDIWDKVDRALSGDKYVDTHEKVTPLDRVRGVLYGTIFGGGAALAGTALGKRFLRNHRLKPTAASKRFHAKLGLGVAGLGGVVGTASPPVRRKKR